jgi:two-component system chemotaxis sensor kinase CheA
VHGKSARLIVEGDDVEVDIKVLEMLKDPLTHMIRNAVDHGIESVETRKERGKNPQGRLTLRAMHKAGSIIIELSDDGAGMHLAQILARARQRGLVSDQRTPTDQELYGFVFSPGFSTTEGVTDMSGRGVGLDVVRANVEALRGSVGIESEEGVGTTITIRVPLTLAIIEGFSVGVGDETYVIPMESVVECLELSVEDRRLEQRSGVLNLRGQAIPYLRLRDAFALGGKTPARENIVVIQDGRGRAGIVVDTLYGKQQTVIKPLGKLLGRGVPGITGSAILGSGRVALILDAPRILRDAAITPATAND